MTVTTNSSPATPPSSATRPDTATPPPAADQARVRQRRRPWLALVGAILITLFGLAGAWLATSGRDEVAVVVTTTTLTPGQPIQLSDLTTAQITRTMVDSAIPATRLDGLVGKYPIGAVPSGAILAPGAVVDRVTPVDGESIIAVGMTPTQIPAIGLRPGDSVILVMAFTSVGVPVEEGPQPGQTWEAEVVSVGSPRDDGTVTVDFTLEDAPALEAAAAAGTGSLTVVLIATVDGR